MAIPALTPMLTQVKAALKKLPGIRALVAQRDQLQVQRDELLAQRDQVQAQLNEFRKSHGFVPPGHFYSPIPAFDEIRRDEARIFGPVPRQIVGIDLNENAQLNLLKKFVSYYPDMPFMAEKQPGLRYCYENPAYSYSDAILLHCMIRHLGPKRIIEVGSGFSSCMMLDTNELFFNDAIATTFIEPYPELLMSLLKESDHQRIKVIPTRLQDVDLHEFDALEANDILFIDSTHVSKIDSDVNRILFDILPRLASGVQVHFHDIFFPFEYPQEWVNEGRVWSEAYILRAFLEFNSGFSVVLMNTFMERFHEPFFQEHLPLCMKNTGGSIWLRKK